MSAELARGAESAAVVVATLEPGAAEVTGSGSRPLTGFLYPNHIGRIWGQRQGSPVPPMKCSSRPMGN